MQFTTLTLVGLVSGAVAFPALIKPRQDAATVKLHQLTEYYMFNITNEAFITARSAQKDAKLGLDWSADGCSSSPDDPFGFDFHNSCLRHDFGYRNYKKQKRCGSKNKKLIDKNFKKDMFAYCLQQQDEDKRDACEGVAKVYYGSVRVFGKSSFC